MGLLDLKKHLNGVVENVKSTTERLQSTVANNNTDSAYSDTKQNVSAFINKINELQRTLDQYAKLINQQDKMLEQTNRRIEKLELSLSNQSCSSADDKAADTPGQLSAEDVVYHPLLQQQLIDIRIKMNNELMNVYDNMGSLKNYVEKVVKNNFLNEPD